MRDTYMLLLLSIWSCTCAICGCALHTCMCAHTHTSTHKHTHALTCTHMHTHKDFKLFCFYCFIYLFLHIKGKQHSMWNSPVNVHNQSSVSFTQSSSIRQCHFSQVNHSAMTVQARSVDDFRLTVTPLPHTRMHTHTHPQTLMHTHEHTHTHELMHTHAHTHTNMHTYQSNKQKKREQAISVPNILTRFASLRVWALMMDTHPHTHMRAHVHKHAHTHTHTHTHTQHTISQPPPSLLWYCPPSPAPSYNLITHVFIIW